MSDHVPEIHCLNLQPLSSARTISISIWTRVRSQQFQCVPGEIKLYCPLPGISTQDQTTIMPFSNPMMNSSLGIIQRSSVPTSQCCRRLHSLPEAPFCDPNHANGQVSGPRMIDSRGAKKYLTLPIFLRTENCQWLNNILEAKSISESVICIEPENLSIGSSAEDLS
jgi:hypothetical protein